MQKLKIKEKLLLGLTGSLLLVSIPAICLADACDNTNSTQDLQNCVRQDAITQDLLTIVNVLGAGVGIVVIGMIIVGGIQYSIAGDNPQATAAAKTRIMNALIALVLYLFIFAFLQWLIPGGLFNSNT